MSKCFPCACQNTFLHLIISIRPLPPKVVNYLLADPIYKNFHFHRKPFFRSMGDIRHGDDLICNLAAESSKKIYRGIGRENLAVQIFVCTDQLQKIIKKLKKFLPAAGIFLGYCSSGNAQVQQQYHRYHYNEDKKWNG